MAILQLFLSDNAFQGLRARAVEIKYVRGAYTAKGLGLYLYALLLANPEASMWADTRPQNIKDYVIDELENGTVSTWDDGEVRRSRRLEMSPTFRINTAHIAKQLGVVRNHPNIGPSRALSLTTLTSEFWEAVGLGWLTPQAEATGPSYTLPPRKFSKEIEWL